MAAACSEPADNPLESLEASGDDTMRYVAYFEEADLQDLAEDDPATRGQRVIETLQDQADRTQSEALDMAADAGVEVESSWVANAIIAEGGPETADALAELPGVVLVASEPMPPPGEGHELASVEEPDGPGWHIERSGADEATAAGHTGEDVTVAIVDTGVDFSHAALNGPRSEAGWVDVTGDCSEPCDEAGHGTAAAGLIFGEGPGIAPGVEVIAVRACGPESCELTDLFAATEWLLAPEGDPALAPQVVSGSWGAPPGAPGYDRIVRAMAAAGMIVVLAAGNDGPTCATIETPADQPEALAVGSVDSDGEIDPRSSRGPSGATDEGAVVKPDLVAPGVDVITTGTDGGWVSASGTSFAAPIVAGAVAVLLAADPELAGDAEAVRDLLAAGAATTEDLGCDGPAGGGTIAAGAAEGANQTYGAGELHLESSLRAGR